MTVFRLVRIWRDDLEWVHKILSEGMPSNYSITAEGYALESVSDLDELIANDFEVVRDLKVASDDGRVTFELSRNRARLTVVAPDLKATGAISQIRNRMLDRQDFPRLLLVIALPLLAFFGLTFAAINSFFLQGVAAALSVTYMLSVIAILVFFLSKIPLETGYLLARTRKEAPTFFQRKKDDIGIAVVFLILGGVLGYFVNELTDDPKTPKPAPSVTGTP